MPYKDTQQVRRSAEKKIPLDIQEGIRNRLMLLRTATGKRRSDIRTMTAATLAKMEGEDISSIKMGDLWSLADEYGITLPEMLMYLASGEEDQIQQAITNRTKRAMVHLHSLRGDPGLEELAINMIAEVSSYRIQRDRKELVDDDDERAPQRMSAREILAQAARAQQEGRTTMAVTFP